jgi:imidazolonepropionase-like amidohydrolase
VTLTTPSGGLVSGLSSAMNMDGWTWEQMTLEAAAALNVNWPNAGGGGRGGGGRGGGGDGGYDGQLRTLRNYFAQARAYRDAKAAGDQIRSDSRFDAMIPALNREIPVIVNANDIRQIQDAIRWAEDEDIRLVIRGGEDAVYVAEHLAEAQIPVILTSTMDGPARAWQPYDEAYSRAARLHEAGVQIAISGGGGAAYTNRLPYEAGVAVAFGLPEEEAVKAVTINAARFVGIDDRVGSLETGKEATLLVTTGNPLDYLSNIEQAYIQGRNIDMVDIHRFFFDKYIQRVRLFLRIVS